MNYSALAYVATDEVRGVSCVYSSRKGEKTYIFKTTRTDLEVGDKVVVQSSQGMYDDSTCFGYLVIEVIEVDVALDLSHGNIDYKWIIDKVDLDAFEEILAREKDLIQKIKKTELEAHRKQIREAWGIEGESFKLLSTSKGEETNG